ncbi:MAG: polyphosphate:AMP phosphotransferase [Methylobacter sp.]|nr:polyphosphate:AMP phosphotransferase [Methylobacter sp.]MDP2097740.1 polyphosphate:AMP phosphotransferase [Methylobacter sp.]MDP2430216.1 polyphosphate:AMP phosphotransferase [Methylobacter sp.]MDP3056151.1 polyphosphate:AMP phosphotransferase [Methylobacter sp.]MDP3364356.1 polyphosphate:AMP phosphotransferase [Methylobacter sp.]
MFESAELGHKIDKETYNIEVPKLREALLEAQIDLAKLSKFPVIILIGGLDGAGRGETVNLLNEWMDPRFIQTHGMGEPSDEELDRPMMWRFWRELPPKGKIGVFLGSWYTWPIINRVNGHTKVAELDQSLERAKRLESMLVAEGALVLKFWMHLSKDRQEKRLKLLEKNPQTRWRVTDRDWKHFKLYDKFRVIHESVIRHTSTAEAPWIIVEGYDPNYRNLTVGKVILDAINKRLDDANKKMAEVHAPPPLPSIDQLNILKTLDLSQKIEKKEFKDELEKYQGKLALLTREAKFKDITVIVMFEGNDAAGKGGAIRRITSALDARFYSIVPVAAPTEEERAQPYLWRFWRHIPRRGRVTIFDRSWYGRVLVERVEDFCSKADWMRAYSEINDFEAQLVRHNIVVVKFWLAISKEEQLNRFNEREKIGFKRFKITDEDWRNREKWDDYEHAVCDMVDRTSTEIAPWTLVEANDKRFARIKVLKTLCKHIEAALGKK